MDNTVNVSELRVGMFVHLDLGWMSHPFPLSSFKIVSPDQIDTIRGLGKQTLRWAPDKSDLIDAGTLGAAAAPAAAALPSGPIVDTPAQAAARERRAQLSRQREAALVCETQYSEAGQAWRAAFERVASKPVQARQDTEALTQALLDKMLGEGEMCIRVLNSASGDRATAHAMNVAVISLLMGRSFGFAEADMADLGVGALLHDAGKIDLPERMRHHDERFSPSETEAYREHVAFGVTQGRRMGLSAGAMLVLAQHHEHADGSGFPLKLSADRMTPAARIVSLVNRFDNLCNPPVLARAMTPHEALSMMFAQSRARFDATTLNAFIRMMGVYPAGSVVQLTDDRFAMVVSVNSSRPLKPRVMVHDPKVPRDEALHLDLETTPDLGIRRSIRAAQLPPAAMDYLAPRPRLAYFFEASAPAPAHAAQAEAVFA
jgi:HD-GYP domain-containing protein (c-di-GMP phosphodiesterase class II)